MEANKTTIDESNTNGGENNISELHERVQAAMRPYVDEILDAEYTSILSEGDENWYLSVHWGEWDSLLSDGTLTSEEFNAISSEYHSIVGDKWRNDDPENRWSNAAPYGDGYALILEKPSEDSVDDSNEPEFSVGTEWDAVHEDTDGFTIYSRDIVRVRVADYNEYYDLEMLDSDGEVVVGRNISPGRVKANIEANDGAFCISVPEDEFDVATDDGDEPVAVTGYVSVAPGERVETDTPVDSTVYQMIKLEERAELIRACATIVRESDADLTPTLVDMLDEIDDQSDKIQNSVREIMVTYDE